ncbi:MAG: hypothetical protein ACPGKS_00100 [Coraliomargarita sp.]
MNSNRLPKPNTFSYPIVLGELTDLVEVQLSDQFEPTLLDLNEIFGALELQFEAAVETSAVVELKLLKKRGILVLQSADGSTAGQAARVAVRATAPDGVSTVVLFRVRTVRQQIAA